MTVEKMTDQELVNKLRELKGLAKIKESLEDEVRARVSSGDDLSAYGVNIGYPTERKKLKSADEIAQMLLPAFDVSDIYDTPSVVKGKLTVA